MKKLLLSVALVGYAFGASFLSELALKNNYDIKVLEEQKAALLQEVDLSKVWENLRLGIGAKDIFFDEPLKRDAGAQNEFIEFSQKIPTGSKLDIKASIAQQNVAVKSLEIKDKKLDITNSVMSLQYTLGRIDADMKTLARYEKLLIDLKAAHLAYSSTVSAHYNQTLSNTILEKNIVILQKSLVREKGSVLHKLESIINTSVSDDAKLDLALMPYTKSNEEATLKEHNPKLLLQRIQTQKELNNLNYEKEQKIPDVTVALGYNHRESRDDMWYLSFSIPLPLYGREELSIRKAELTQNASEQSENALQNKLVFDLQDELLNKELQQEKIGLNQAILEENRRIYDNILSTSFSQNDALVKLLSNLTTSLDTELKINTLTLGYDLSCLKINYLLGEL
ncbi:MAG: TolC family protein [Sulfurospirillaceae bacterium]|nr:TolC family protein [Sulfurospirillaceae bacterium]